MSDDNELEVRYDVGITGGFRSVVHDSMVGASRESLCGHFHFLTLHYYGFPSWHGVGYEVGGLLVITISIGGNGVHGLGIWNIPLRWLGMGWMVWKKYLVGWWLGGKHANSITYIYSSRLGSIGRHEV